MKVLIADKFVNETNFLSILGNYYKKVRVPTDSKLGDNGNGEGSDYQLSEAWGKDGYKAARTGL